MRLNNASRSTTEDADFGKKKPAQETRTHILISRGGFWSRAIFGPFFFENKQGEAVTVLGDRYRAMLNEFLLLLYNKFSISIIIEEEDIGNIWFQQDDATYHTTEATLYVLHPVFKELRFHTVGLLFVWCRKR